MKRCSGCNRLKLLGGGWESVPGDTSRIRVPPNIPAELVERFKTWTAGEDLYCPKCLAEHLARLKAEKEAAEKILEAEVRRGLAHLCSQLRQLAEIAEGKVVLPAALHDSGIKLSKKILTHFVVFQTRKYKEFPEGFRDCVADLQNMIERDIPSGLKLTILQKVSDEVTPLLNPLFRILSRIRDPRDGEEVRALLKDCFDLTVALDIRFRYFDCDGTFPVDFFVHLASLDHEATLDALCTTVSNEAVDPRIRVAIIVALGRIGDRRATDPLLVVLQQEDTWGSVVPGAACALTDLQDERAVDAVMEAMSSRFGSGAYGHWKSRLYISQRLMIR